MAEEKEKKENELDNKTSRNKAFPTKMIVLVIMILSVIGGSLFAWQKGAISSLLSGGGKQKATVEKKKDIPQDIGPIYSLSDFIVNLNEPLGRRYLKAKVELELDGNSVKVEIDKRLPQLRDGILTLLSGKTYSDISDLTGKFQLRAEILSLLNGYLTTGKIKNVYFTEFIVQ